MTTQKWFDKVYKRGRWLNFLKLVIRDVLSVKQNVGWMN